MDQAAHKPSAGFTLWIAFFWSHEPRKLERVLECLNAMMMDITSTGDPLAQWVTGLPSQL